MFSWVPCASWGATCPWFDNNICKVSMLYFFGLHKYFCVSKGLKWWHWTGRKKTHICGWHKSFICSTSMTMYVIIQEEDHDLNAPTPTHTFVGGTCLRFPNSEAHLAWHALPIFLEIKHSFWIHENTWTWTCSVLTYNMEWPEVTINSNATSCKSTFLLDPNVESQLLLSCKTSALVCSGPRKRNLHQKLISIFQMLFVAKTDLFAWCWLPGFESHLLQPAQFQSILCIEVEHIVMPCPCPPPVAWNPYPLKQGQSLWILPLLYEHWRHDG